MFALLDDTFLDAWLEDSLHNHGLDVFHIWIGGGPPEFWAEELRRTFDVRQLLRELER